MVIEKLKKTEAGEALPLIYWFSKEQTQWYLLSIESKDVSR